MNIPTSPASTSFSSYQKVVVGMLAFLQFAVILDFMLMAPLGALIMPSMSITPAQFGSYMAAEVEKWGKVVRLSGIRPE